MATHSSILAQRIPWTEEAGRLQPVGSHGVRHDRATEHRVTQDCQESLSKFPALWVRKQEVTSWVFHSNGQASTGCGVSDMSQRSGSLLFQLFITSSVLQVAQRHYTILVIIIAVRNLPFYLGDMYIFLLSSPEFSSAQVPEGKLSQWLPQKNIRQWRWGVVMVGNQCHG